MSLILEEVSLIPNYLESRLKYNIIFGIVSNKAKEATSGAQNSQPAQWHLATAFLLGPHSSPRRNISK